MHTIISKVIVNYLFDYQRQIYKQIDQYDDSNIGAGSN